MSKSGSKSLLDMSQDMSLLQEFGLKKNSLSRVNSFHRTRHNTMGSGLINPDTLDIPAVDEINEASVSLHLADYNTDPFLLEDRVLIYLAKHMLDSYGLIERFNVNVSRLRSFLIAVCNGYRKNSFHNFKHAWGTMHLVYQILRNGADDHLTSLDILSVLIAAICHDLDHPGNNNAFEVATRSALAITYSDDAVLERHHCRTALNLLSDPKHDFVDSMSLSDKAGMRYTIINSIMATDMSQHFVLLRELRDHNLKQEPFLKENIEERTNLTRIMLHCADIGAQTQTQALALNWAERCLDEFASQGAKEEELKLELTPFMQGLDDRLTRMQLQLDFVEGIVVPLWTALASSFPNLEFAAVQAVASKCFYAEQVSTIIEGRKELDAELGIDVIEE
jgi:hypothetical protein